MTALYLHKGAVQPPVSGWDQDELASNKFTYSEPTVAQLIVATNVSDAGTSIAGFDNSIYIGDNSLVRAAYPPIDVVFGDGEVVYCAFYVEMDDASEPVPAVSTSSGDFCVVIGGSPTTGVTLLPNEQVAGTNVWKVSAYRTEDAAPSGAHGVIKFTGQSSKGFKVSGYHVYKGALPEYIKTEGSAIYNGRLRTEASTAWPGSFKTTVTNYFPYSACLVGWFATGNALQVATNRYSPSGGDAIQIIDDASGGTNNAQLRETITLDASTQYTMSVEATADQLDWVRLSAQSLDVVGGSPSAYFDLTNGVLGATLGSGNDAADITDIGGGWYLCELTFTTASSGDLSGNLTIFIAEADNDNNVDLDGTSSIIVGNAQLEKASSASPHRVFTHNEAGKTQTFGGNVIYLNKGAVQPSASPGFMDGTMTEEEWFARRRRIIRRRRLHDLDGIEEMWGGQRPVRNPRYR